VLVNNTPQPLGETKAEITPSVKSITQDTHAAVLENLKFISASDSGCKRIKYYCTFFNKVIKSPVLYW
jgi:hypothetical protein